MEFAYQTLNKNVWPSKWITFSENILEISGMKLRSKARLAGRRVELRPANKRLKES